LGENNSLLIIEDSNDDEDGGGVNGDGSEGNSPSWQGAGTETSVPRNWSSMAAACGTFLGETPISLGFSRRRDFIGGGAMSEGTQGKIGTSGFFSSNSENISCVTFLKHKNSRKQELALWHLVNRLVQKMHKNATKCKQNTKQLV
jgi:hypothetical protein